MGTSISKPTTTAVAIDADRSLKPASDREIFDALEPLFLAFGKDATQLGQKVTMLYLNAIQGEPLWAVNLGVTHLVKGTAPGVNRNFLPTVPAFATEVRRQSEGIRERRERWEKLRTQETARREEAEADERARQEPISAATRARIDSLLAGSVRRA